MEPTARREQILGAAAGLFGQKGYHATSISDIIEAASIARGTFYLYFQNKRAIFEELVDDLVVEIKRCILRVDVTKGSSSPREQLEQNIARVAELLMRRRALLSILLEGGFSLDRDFQDKLADFYAQMARTIESSLKLGQEMGIVRPCNTRLAACAALGTLKEVLRDLLDRKEEQTDLALLAAQIIDIYSRGVLAEGVSIE